MKKFLLIIALLVSFWANSARSACSPQEYPYTTVNCRQPKVLGGRFCQGRFTTCTVFKFSDKGPCSVNNFPYTSNNCKPPKKLGGVFCQGRFTTCDMVGLNEGVGNDKTVYDPCTPKGYKKKVPNNHACYYVKVENTLCYTDCEPYPLKNPCEFFARKSKHIKINPLEYPMQ